MTPIFASLTNQTRPNPPADRSIDANPSLETFDHQQGAVHAKVERTVDMAITKNPRTPVPRDVDIRVPIV